MLTFKTETGSVYEIDRETKRARRLSGAGTPTRRFGNGEWREYVEVSDIKLYYPVWFAWVPDTRYDDVRMKNFTETSRVVEWFEEVE